MTIRKNQIEALSEIVHNGGAVLASSWVNGSGRYITARAIPPFCKRIERYEAADYPKRIQEIFAKHPRAKSVVAIVDMRSAKKELKWLN
jgi:hypothetical protein